MTYPPPPQTGSDGEQPPTEGDASWRPAAEGTSADASGAGLPSYPGEMPSYPQSAGPTAYPPAHGTAATAERPETIVRAVKLMWVGSVLSAIGLIVGLLTLGTVKDNIRQALVDGNNYSQSNLDTAYNTTIVLTVVAGVVGIALWLWMAYLNGRGRKWARIVSTVFGGLSIVSFLAAIAQGQQTVVAVALSGITAVLAVVILVLLWKCESSAYYDAQSRRQY